MAETVQRDFLFPNLGFDDLLSLSVVLQKEMQNPAKYRVEAPPSALAADESQIKVPALAFYANDITRVPALFLNVVPNLLAVCGPDRTDCCCWCVLLGLTGL